MVELRARLPERLLDLGLRFLQLDAELFEEGDESGEWVLLGDEVPVDERARDELVERFDISHHPGTSGAVAATEDDPDELDEELEPDEEDEL